MNKYSKRLIKIVLVIIPIAAWVLLSQDYLFYNLDNNTVRVKQFYQEEKNSLDVVLLGASEVYTGFSPATAYKNYGFTSYPFVIGANPASLYKSQLKEVLKRQNPQLIVVEINGFIYPDDEMLSNEGKIRRYVDNIPMSQNRIESIMQVDYDDKLSCLVPFIKYHGISSDPGTVKWNLLNKTFIISKTSMLKGISTFNHVNDVSDGIIDVTSDNTKLPLTQKSKEYLDDFLNYCQSDGLNNVVFVRFPHPIVEGKDSYDCYARSNTVEQIVTEHGFKYYGYDKLINEIGLDYKTDFYDGNHLNVYGQKKMTEFLSGQIANEWNLIPKVQTESNKKLWEESVKYTDAYFLEMDKRIKKKADDWPFENTKLISSLSKEQ